MFNFGNISLFNNDSYTITDSNLKPYNKRNKLTSLS